MLKVSDIHTYYGESYILKGVSLQVERGAVVALLGRNGMGKTTLVTSIIGFNPPRRGRISLENKDISRLRPFAISRLGIGLVPQGRRIFPSLSVRENLTTAARGTKRKDVWSLDRIYSIFPILKERYRIKGNLLSGGEQTMLSISRALLTNPSILLMDEPSEGLAPSIVQQVGLIMKMLKEEGISILLIEPNLSLVLSVADYVYIINKGEIVHESQTKELVGDVEAQIKYLGVTK
jgi:branched-chain amino acid transport system ATP-binding protein